MKTFVWLRFVVCVSIMAFEFLGVVHADTPAYVATGTETDLGAYGISGIEFTLNENIQITQLGFTALSLGGGDTPQVTVWQVGAGGALTQLYTTGNILGSVTSYPEGTGEGTPSFVPVSTSLLLTAGNTYLVTAPAYWAATYDSGSITTADGGVFNSTSFLTTGPGGWHDWSNSSYLGGAPNVSSFSLASGVSVPGEANFEFTTAEVAVPEPSTYALIGGGMAALALMLRRRQRE